MFRAYFYLAAAGAVWLIEGALFSHFLDFAAWQVALVIAIYLALYGIALRVFVRSPRLAASDKEFSAWRLVTLAPMLVVIVGSFASLPLLLLVVVLGKVV